MTEMFPAVGTSLRACLALGDKIKLNRHVRLSVAQRSCVGCAQSRGFYKAACHTLFNLGGCGRQSPLFKIHQYFSLLFLRKFSEITEFGSSPCELVSRLVH